jgi:hypothetical protein
VQTCLYILLQKTNEFRVIVISQHSLEDQGDEWGVKWAKPRCIQTNFVPLYTLNMPGRPVPAPICKFERNEPVRRSRNVKTLEYLKYGLLREVYFTVRPQYNRLILDQLAIVGEKIIAGWMHPAPAV